MVYTAVTAHSHKTLNIGCFLFRYPNLDIPSQALFNRHRECALPLRCGSEDKQTFQSPPGHSRQTIRQRRNCMVPVWHSVMTKQNMCTGLSLFFSRNVGGPEVDEIPMYKNYLVLLWMFS